MGFSIEGGVQIFHVSCFSLGCASVSDSQDLFLLLTGLTDIVVEIAVQSGSVACSTCGNGDSFPEEKCND